MEYANLCMNCMKSLGNGHHDQCPHCLYHTDSPQSAPFLPVRTIVGEKYLVGAVQQTDGDSITYMAYDTKQETPVLLREFFSVRIANRIPSDNTVNPRPGKEELYTTLKDSYRELWHKLEQMTGLSSLIRVLDCFDDNNTVYAVTEHVEGAVSFRDYLLETKDGYLTWKNARILFMPLLSTLSSLHGAGIIHRGISPATLFMYPDGKLRITGFSIPEGRILGSELNAEVFTGYTPIEQLGLQAPAGPWTDIYSFAAVLYRTLIGKAPVDAMKRIDQDTMKIPAKFADKIPANVIRALINALQVFPEDRTRNVDLFHTELSDSRVTELANEYKEEEKQRRRRISSAEREDRDVAVGAGIIEEEDADEAQGQKEKGKSNLGLIISIIAIIVAIIVLLGVYFGSNSTLFKEGAVDEEEQTTISSEDGEKVSVPDFVGMTAGDAESNYSDSFSLDYTYEENDSVASGTITKQSINEGTMVAKGTTISLTVSSGPAKITMPDVIGQSYDAAKASLEALGFQVESGGTIPNNGSENANTVARTSLTAGNKYDKGAVVLLTMWAEEETTTESTTASTTETTVEGLQEGEE